MVQTVVCRSVSHRWRLRGGCHLLCWNAASDLSGCFWMQQSYQRKAGEEGGPDSQSHVWPLICRLWFGLSIKSPRGPKAIPPFVQVDSKDNRKCLEPAAPRGSNLTFSFLFQTSLLPLSRFTHSTACFISSSLQHHFFLRFLLNLPLPLIQVYKGSLLYGPDGETTLRQRLLAERNGNNK